MLLPVGAVARVHRQPVRSHLVSSTNHFPSPFPTL
jgi:hypothetical protein